MHTENASLSWLLGGAVPPFLTTPGVDLDDSANMLADFLAEENWHVAFVDAAGDCMFVLHRPAAIVHDKGTIQYRAITVLTGPHGKQSLDVVRVLRAGRVDNRAVVSRHQLQRIRAGMCGTWALFGNARQPGVIDPGQVRHGVDLDDSYLAVADREEHAYGQVPAPAQAIADAWESLPAERRQALELVVAGLINPPPKK